MKKLFLVILCLILVGSAYAAKLDSPLVSVQWLNKHLDEVIVLDVRKSMSDFIRGHIPGARFVDKSKVRVDKKINGKMLEGFLPDKNYFEGFLRNLGVNNDSAVVIYTKQKGAVNAKYAARLYWQFKVYGFKNVALLDGGYYKWVDEIKKIEKGAGKKINFGNVELKNVDKNMIADFENVKKLMSDQNSILIDFRNLELYLGISKKSYVLYPGHIPGSYMMPESIFFKKDGTYISKNDIYKTLRALNIDINKNQIVYCNTGNHASVGWFILHELMGAKNVLLYDGSLIEWTNLNMPTKQFVIENFTKF